MRRLLEVLEAGEVFAYDVKLDVDASAETEGVEVGVVHGVGDDGYAE